ncbi:MAG: prepilin-type N-terminal cleavage/methylation domain-containing protein [Sedimentisphaerales bacterium]|nr:prepilin-type N-terminal cleavage/methylation domain-containing protein [Sedimentisphaerales bacterium]
MRTAGTTHSGGFTLVELIITVVIAAIPIFAIGTLLVGAQQGWQDSYNSVHKEIQQDALATMTTFGNIGRKSNRSNYKVYRIIQGAFIEATPASGDTLATGQAVEMHYWENPPASLDLDMLDTTNTGTHFALFYLDGDELKVDLGEVVDGIGAVNNGSRTASDVETQVLAHNVDTTNDEIFSHTVIGGDGQGCVRLNLNLEDDDGQRVEVKTATLLRIVWPQ